LVGLRAIDVPVSVCLWSGAVKLRAGRENLFEFDPAPLEEIKKYIDLVSEQWDQTLSRLKSFVER
jgi:hypothetical protein